MRYSYSSVCRFVNENDDNPENDINMSFSGNASKVPFPIFKALPVYCIYITFEVV